MRRCLLGGDFGPVPKVSDKNAIEEGLGIGIDRDKRENFRD